VFLLFYIRKEVHHH